MHPSPFADSGITVVEAMEDPNLFCGLFTPAEDWRAWRVALKALFALPMDEDELVLFRECTGREVPPAEPSAEAYWIIGRRGGKSRVAALVAVYLALFKDYSHVLVPGEPGVVLVVAQDVPSGDIILGYVRALLASVPEVQGLVLSDIDGEIMLANGTTVSVRAANYRAVRSRTYIGALADEACFWWVARDSANPDVEVLGAIRPGLATTGGPLVVLSSPFSEEGAVWEAHRDHYGKTGLVEGVGPEGEPVTAPRPLIWQAPTLRMNPNNKALRARVRAAYATDPGAASAEYGGLFRQVTEGFLPKELIAAAVATGVEALPYHPSYPHRAAFDPASGTGADSATLSIARLVDGVSELALLKEWRPPFDPAEAIREAAGLIKSYSLTAVSGDRWAKGLVSDLFVQNGVAYQFTDRSTSQFYSQLPPLLASRAVRLLDSERLVRQMAALRRKLGSQGQEQVTHPGKAHDDCANSAAVALVLVRAPGVPQTVEEEEAQRPEGSFEKKARDVAAGYEPAIIERYGEAQGRVLLANARTAASVEGDFDPEVYEANLEDLLPDLARYMRGQRAAGWRFS